MRTTWSGCAGRAGSPARTAVMPEAGGWAMAAWSVLPATGARRMAPHSLPEGKGRQGRMARYGQPGGPPACTSGCLFRRYFTVLGVRGGTRSPSVVLHHRNGDVSPLHANTARDGRARI